MLVSARGDCPWLTKAATALFQIPSQQRVLKTQEQFEQQLRRSLTKQAEVWLS